MLYRICETGEEALTLYLEQVMIFVKRWLFALALVAATWNPTPFNYIRWSLNHLGSQLPLIILFGIVLFIGWSIFIRATMRSIGKAGVVVSAALGGAILWVLHDFGLVNFANPRFTAWLVILGASLVLGLGMSWSYVRRKLTGQVDVDDVEE